MPTQIELDTAYMACAKAHAALSKAKRTKVGCIIVTPSGALLGGCNGSPSGYDNNLEDELEDGTLVTKEIVIHGERSAILAAARQGVSLLGSTCYVSLSPCVQCAAMLYQAGVKRLVYAEVYRDTSGLDFCEHMGVDLLHFQPKD